MRRFRVQALFVAASTLLAAPTRAQTEGAIALDRLEPAPAGDALVGVPSPGIGGHLIPRVELLFNQALGALSLQRDGDKIAIVGSQSTLAVNTSLALWDRLQVSALLPVVVAQSGDGTGATGEKPLSTPTAPVLGDLRLGARLRAYETDDELLQIAAGFFLHIPTGASHAFAGEGSARVTPQLVAGGRMDRLFWSAAGGFVARSSGNPSTISYGAGAGALFWNRQAQATVELYGQTPVQPGSFQLTDKRRLPRQMSSGVELLVGAQVHVLGSFKLGVALGPGFGDAPGTPAFRAVTTIDWTGPSLGPVAAPPPVHPDDVSPTGRARATSPRTTMAHTWAATVPSMGTGATPPPSARRAP